MLQGGEYREGAYDAALTRAFHRMDEMLRQEEFDAELKVKGAGQGFVCLFVCLCVCLFVCLSVNWDRLVGVSVRVDGWVGVGGFCGLLGLGCMHLT